MGFWTQLLINGLSSSIALGVLFMLVRSILERDAQKQIIKMQSALNQDLEKFKQELVTATVYMNNSLINLSGERFRYIQELYAAVAVHVSDMRELISPHFPRSTAEEEMKKFHQAEESVIKMSQIFNERQILFSVHLAAIFDQHERDNVDFFNDHKRRLQFNGLPNAEQRQATWVEYQPTLKTFHDTVTKEFRKMLAVES